MSRAGGNDESLADLDELIEEITVHAHGDDEKLWADPGLVPPGSNSRL